MTMCLRGRCYYTTTILKDILNPPHYVSKCNASTVTKIPSYFINNRLRLQHISLCTQHLKNRSKPEYFSSYSLMIIQCRSNSTLCEKKKSSNYLSSFKEINRLDISNESLRFFKTQSSDIGGIKVQRQSFEDKTKKIAKKIKRNINESKDVPKSLHELKTKIISKNKEIKKEVKKRIPPKYVKENIKTVPNLLTLLRIGSAPALSYFIVNDYFGMALSLFVFAGLTDMADGYIARNFKNQRTAFGTFMDPLADKILMSFLTISLTSAGLIPVPLTVLIISRDAGLIFGGIYARWISLSPPKTLSRYFEISRVTVKLYPSFISKLNTGVQFSYVAATLASPVFDFVDHPLMQVLMFTTAATTFLSGADYMRTWRNRLKIVKN